VAVPPAAPGKRGTADEVCGNDGDQGEKHDGTVHLVLLDMHMPRLTGLETSQLLHQINALLPTILVTADATDSLLRRAVQAHVYSVIPKPVSKHVVLYTVVRALARFHGGRGGEGGRG
jgi:CheY-like chemotaxis protein